MNRKFINHFLAVFASAAMLFSTVQCAPVNAETEMTPTPTETPAAETSEPTAAPSASADTEKEPAAPEATEPAATVRPETEAAATPETGMQAQGDTTSAPILNSLSLSVGDISFDSQVFSYQTKVASDTYSVTVNFTLADATNTAKVNGNNASVSSGAGSYVVNLSYGANDITVSISTADGSATSNYSIEVTRPIRLQDLHLGAKQGDAFEFKPDTSSYDISVAAGVDRVNIYYTRTDSSDLIYLNGGTEPVDEGDDSSEAIYLAFGMNELSVRVKSADNSEEFTYQLHVTRETKGTLKDLHLDAGDAFPFYPHVLYYSTTVNYDVNFITMYYTKENSDDTVKINGSSIDAGGDTSSKPMPLKFGANILTIEVDSSDKTVQSKYSVCVTRMAQPQGGLSDLHLSAGDPFVFNPDQKDYYVEVPYETDAVTMYYTKLASTDKVSLNGGSYFTNGDASSKPVYLQPGENTLTVSVQAADGSASAEYTLTVYRIHSTTTELNDIKVNGTSVGMEHGKYEYTVEATEGSVLIAAAAAASDEQVLIDGSPIPDAGYSKILDPNDASLNEADITVYSGDMKHVLTYKLKFVYSYQVTTLKFSTASAWIDTTKTDKTLDVSQYLTSYPNYSGISLDWSSSDEKVATVDQNGMVTAVGTGVAKITAAHQNMLGGTVKNTISASMNVSVSPLADSDKLVLELTGYAGGGETGDSYPVYLYRYSDRTSIPLSDVQINSTNAAVAAFNGTDAVVFAGAGSATLSASLSIGSVTKTSAGVAVKGLVQQVHSITVAPAAELDPAVFAATYNDTQKTDLAEVDVNDISSVTFGTTAFTVKAALKNKLGAAADTSVKWTSSDAAIASVKLDAEKNAVVTLRKQGEVTITVQAQDQLKASSSFRLVIKNYAPALESSVFTINQYSAAGAPIAIHQAYDNAITGMTVCDRKTGTPRPEFKIDANNNILIADGQSLANASYSVQLKVATDKGTFQLPIVIKVVSKEPQASVKLEQYVNSFVNDGQTYAWATIDPKGNTVRSVTINNSATDDTAETNPYFTIEPETAESWAHAYIRPTGTYYENTTARNANVRYLHVKFDGYYDGHNEATVKITVPVKSVRPGIKLSSTAATIYQSDPSQAKSVSLQLIDTATNQVIASLNGYKVGFSGAASNAQISGNSIVVTSNGISGTVKLTISNTSWTGSITQSLRINVNTKLPELALGTTSLRFNQQFLNEGHPETAVISVLDKNNTANLEFSDYVFKNLKTDEEDDLFSVSYNATAKTLSIKENTAGKGVYKYQLTPSFENTDTHEEITGKPVTITITVVDQAFTVTAAAKNTLNPIDSSSKTEVLLRMTNMTASVTAADLNDDNFSISVANGKAYLQLKAGVSVNNQIYTINPKFTFSNGTQLYVPVRVRVQQKLPSVKAVPTRMYFYNRFAADTAEGRKIGDVQLQITSFTGGGQAVVKSIEPLYTDTLQKAFEYTWDAATGPLSLSLKDASLIRTSSSSALKFRIHYQGEVLNTTSGTTVTVTLTDKSSAILAK